MIAESERLAAELRAIGADAAVLVRAEDICYATGFEVPPPIDAGAAFAYGPALAIVGQDGTTVLLSPGCVHGARRGDEPGRRHRPRRRLRTLRAGGRRRRVSSTRSTTALRDLGHRPTAHGRDRPELDAGRGPADARRTPCRRPSACGSPARASSRRSARSTCCGKPPASATRATRRCWNGRPPDATSSS